MLKNIAVVFQSLYVKVFSLIFGVTCAFLLAALWVIAHYEKSRAMSRAEGQLSHVRDMVAASLAERPDPTAFTDDLARDLKRRFGADVTLFSGESMVASSLPPGERPAWSGPGRTGNGRGYSKPIFHRRLWGKDFLEAAGGSSDGKIRYLLLRPFTESPASLGPVRKALVLAALLILVFAGTVGFAFSRAMVGPLEELARGTQFVMEGRYDQRVSVPDKGEMGRMAESFNRMLRGLQEREHIRSAMDKVVSREIAEELLKGDLKLGGEMRFSTVMFADIRGFTGLSETIDPKQLVGFLNEYLTLMSRVVEKNHGVIDKYMGDSIMALFGAPVAHETDVDNCLQTALEMVWALNDFNYRRAWESQEPISVSIGVNTGPVIAGNMGSEHRMNYTVVGDTVNLSNRLEGLTRLYSVNCLVSEFTQRESRRGFIFRELDLVRVKGRSASVRIFELWDQEQNREGLSEFLQKFQNARNFYLLKDWTRAEALFGEVLRIRPKDGPSQLYLSRLQDLRRTPPPDSWDGVYTALTK